MTRRVSGQIGRREFLAGATAVAAAGQAVGAPAPGEVEWRNKQSGMTYRKLGRTGFMVSSMAMGGNFIAPDNHDQVLWAIDHGLNYLDTSPTYGRGRSEEGYAAVLKARGRENVFLTSKVDDELTRDRKAYREIFSSLPDDEQAEYRKRVREELERTGAGERDYIGLYWRGQDKILRDTVLNNLLAEKYADKVTREVGFKERVIHSVEESLTRLGTDYLDCLLCPHGVDTPFELDEHPEIFEAFEVLRKQGKVRHFGFSAHTDPAGALNKAMGLGHFSMALVAYNFINHSYVDEAIKKAKAADFGILVMKAARGLKHPYRRGATVPDRVKKINELIPGDDLTPFQKSIQWVLQSPDISAVVAGMESMELAKQDVPLGFEEGA